MERGDVDCVVFFLSLTTPFSLDCVLASVFVGVGQTKTALGPPPHSAHHGLSCALCAFEG